MPHALHKCAAGHGYPEKPCVLDVCGCGGFIRVTGIVSVAAVMYVSCHVGLLYLHARLFSEKRTVVYHPMFWIFFIVLKNLVIREFVKYNPYGQALPIFNFLPNYYYVAHRSGNTGYLPSSRLVVVRDNS